MAVTRSHAATSSIEHNDDHHDGEKHQHSRAVSFRPVGGRPGRAGVAQRAGRHFWRRRRPAHRRGAVAPADRRVWVGQEFPTPSEGEEMVPVAHKMSNNASNGAGRAKR